MLLFSARTALLHYPALICEEFPLLCCCGRRACVERLCGRLLLEGHAAAACGAAGMRHSLNSALLALYQAPSAAGWAPHHRKAGSAVFAVALFSSLLLAARRLLPCTQSHAARWHCFLYRRRTKDGVRRTRMRRALAFQAASDIAILCRYFGGDAGSVPAGGRADAAYPVLAVLPRGRVCNRSRRCCPPLTFLSRLFLLPAPSCCLSGAMASPSQWRLLPAFGTSSRRWLRRLAMWRAAGGRPAKQRQAAAVTCWRQRRRHGRDLLPSAAPFISDLYINLPASCML